MHFLLFFALAAQSLTWHAKEWHAEWKYWDFSDKKPAGYYQEVTGPAKWLIPKLEYDNRMHLWEVLLEGGWVPLHEKDEIMLDEQGVVRIKGL